MTYSRSRALRHQCSNCFLTPAPHTKFEPPENCKKAQLSLHAKYNVGFLLCIWLKSPNPGLVFTRFLLKKLIKSNFDHFVVKLFLKKNNSIIIRACLHHSSNPHNHRIPSSYAFYSESFYAHHNLSFPCLMERLASLAAFSSATS